MTTETLHPLEEIEPVALRCLETLRPFCTKIVIAGSIRRRRPTVRDIDILCIPSLDAFGFREALSSLVGLIIDGPLIKRGTLAEGIQLDVYIASEETFETLLLVKTGSYTHNIRLTSLAKDRGWHLYANGRGLANDKGIIIARTEQEIFNSLGINYLPPEARDAEVYQSMWNTAKFIPKTEDD